MKIHPGVKPAAWGAVAGAIALAIVGFSQLGWTTGSTAEKMATQRAENRGRRGAGSNLRRKVPAANRCRSKTRRIQQGFLVLGPSRRHREGRLGDDAGKQHTEFGSCERLRRKTRQLDVETPTANRATARVGDRRDRGAHLRR